MNSINQTTVLILGGPKSGKTHYGAQLAIRLSKEEGIAKYFARPENLEPFEEPMERLARGRLCAHTPVGVSKDITLPIEISGGKRANVVWPDYGGEQLKLILSTRSMSASWLHRAQTANGWLLMVRPEHFRSSRDLIHRPIREFEHRMGQADQLPEWVPEATLIEMLQILLFARGLGREERHSEPKMVVGITCWDEATTTPEVLPATLLSTFAPMLGNYLAGVWSRSNLSIVGISALGQALNETDDNIEFVDSGPHRQGYIVLPDGNRTTDLTWPLEILLK